MTEVDVNESIHRAGGPNWCFLCERPNSEVTHMNFCNYGGFLNVEFLCEEHLWDAVGEQAEEVDTPISFIRCLAELSG